MQKIAFVISPVDPIQTTDTVTLFAQYADQPWALLLDSAGDREADNQFDIILHSPSKTIEAYPTFTRITDITTGKVVDRNDDPIAVARELHHAFIGSIGSLVGPAVIKTLLPWSKEELSEKFSLIMPAITSGFGILPTPTSPHA